MSMPNTALMQYLQAKSTLLNGKAQELALSVRGWLSYVPASFPHYTRHTIEHSEKIVGQLSKLLFRDDDPTRPIIALSSVEAYILIAGALLHDSGMVVADEEKKEILRSKDWFDWLAQGDRESRLREIDRIRHNAADQPLVSNFVADVQLRFLIAEFVRARHHVRSGHFLSQNQSALGRFALDDPILTRTIGDICIGHGLDRQELADDFRFPLERDIHDEKVNVRLMAILLRLGDLLDMDSDRACPLLLSAASPLPSNSVAHWTQYRRITHRSTTADRIEIFAECCTQDEHRVLRDWCDWIETEVTAVPRLLSPMRRHGGWRPPVATVNKTGTIRILAIPGASYVPSDWRLHLDPIAVLDRLINDTYVDKLAFVRELLQNAIDATRCQLFLDLERTGTPWPQWPEDLDASVLSNYAIRISVKQVTVMDPLSRTTDVADEISIEDVGTGMTEDIIEEYFLQVGRSYYQSGEFKRRFGFSSIGRFGVGFLSVFSASEHVVVDTTAEADGTREQTRVILTGPRAYLLRERGLREKRGTNVTTRVKQPVHTETLRRKVRSWCKRVEFPIELDVGGHRELILAEKSSAFIGTQAHVRDSAINLTVRALPFNTGYARGELYVFEYSGPAGTRWNKGSWARHEYTRSHPYALVPATPTSVICQNGIDYSSQYESHSYNKAAIRMDYRGPSKHATLERAHQSLDFGPDLGQLFQIYPEISKVVSSFITEHLRIFQGSDNERWMYCQELMDILPTISFWRSLPSTIRVFCNGASTLMSMEGLLRLTEIRTSVSVSLKKYIQESASVYEARLRREETVALGCTEPTLVRSDLYYLSDLSRDWLFTDYYVKECRLIDGDILLTTWMPGPSSDPRQTRHVNGKPIILMDIPSAAHVGFVVPAIGSRSYADTIILNLKHPLTQWWSAIAHATASDPTIAPASAIDTALELIVQPIGSTSPGYLAQLAEYLNEWRTSARTPEHLRPPAMPSKSEFTVQPPTGASRSE